MEFKTDKIWYDANFLRESYNRKQDFFRREIIKEAEKENREDGWRSAFFLQIEGSEQESTCRGELKKFNS